jgi:drug/metabolite transporter (DMT)-like permease
MRSTVFKKLIRLLAYVIGSCICLGAALASAGSLYHQENAFKAGLYLFLTLAGMFGGFYLYFRALRVLSARRRVWSYPAARRPKP